MSDAPEEMLLDQALRDGLRALPIPEPSPGFDTRVLAALCAPQPWWHCLWQPAKPLLLGASCSLAVTLLALHWTVSAPMPAPRPPMLGETERPLASAPRYALSLDALLDRPNLSAGSLSAAWTSQPVSSKDGEGQSDPPERRTAPKRRAQLLRLPVLIV